MSERCSKCNNKIGGMMGISLPDEQQYALVKEMGIVVPDTICHVCFNPYKAEARGEAEKGLKALEGEPEKILSAIPVITFPPPADWDYDILGVVTAQATIATGPLITIVSTFTDFFNKESGMYNKKVQRGEEACFPRLRMNALLLEGNAVVGTSVSYAELTSGHGQILVCATGTAIMRKGDPTQSLKTLLQDINKKHQLYTKVCQGV